jgi:hypothetical protein
MVTILKRAAMVAPALAILMPLASNAAPPDFCRGYAAAAINQVRTGLANPRCARGMEGARWSSDFKVHYSWCLGQGAPAVESERGARTGFLRGCRGM